MKKYLKYAFVFGIIKKISILIFLITNYSFAQTDQFDLLKDETLLEGLSFNFKYQNQTAVHIQFEDKKVKYKWIMGPNNGKPTKEFPYRSRKIDNEIYLVNWHEKELNNFISLIFNFKSRTVASSVIVRYGLPNQFTTFDQGFISKVKKE